MSKTKHTPGPWKLRVSTGYIEAIDIQDSRGLTMAWCSVSTQFGKRGAESITPDDIKANAKLIAAAPDLLKFAQMVADGGCDMSDLMTETRELIAKATK